MDPYYFFTELFILCEEVEVEEEDALEKFIIKCFIWGKNLVS